MALTLGPLLLDAGINPAQSFMIRHAYVRGHEVSWPSRIHADSIDAQIPT